MQIIVTSDTHGLTKPLDFLLKHYPHASAYIHCGDICLDPQAYPQFIVAAGNNDYYNIPHERVVEIDGVRILVMHSHLLGFGDRHAKMVEKAKANNCSIVCYGHTHISEATKQDGIIIVNPGSFYQPRDGKLPSYAVIEIENDNVKIKIEHVDEI